MKHLETTDDIKRYLDSEEYKTITKEIMSIVRKSMINQLKYGSNIILDAKGNVIGRVVSYINMENEKGNK